MPSVGLGALLEGLRVTMTDAQENKDKGIASKSGTVVGVAVPVNGPDAGEVYVQVQPDGDDTFYSVLPKNLTKD
jgi:hypothetical protein